MQNQKMNFNASWSMAVGGMVGGGIFSVIGVIIERAGQWAWLSFLIASLIFLITFGTVNFIAFRQRVPHRLLCLAGSLGCAVAVVISSWVQLQEHPVPLIAIAVLVLLALVGRPWVLRQWQD